MNEKIFSLALVGFGVLSMIFSDDSNASIPETPLTDGPLPDTENVKPVEKFDPRGIRNNNPGNLKKTGDKWQGLAGDDGTFFTFIEPEYGIRAMAKVLNTYYYTHGLKNVSDIITRYAPGTENNTNEYIQFVSNSMGVDPLETLNFPNALFNLVDAIINFENGMNPYSYSLMARGFSLAGINV